VDESEDRAQPPAALVDGGEDGVVEECEGEPGEEVEGIAERFGARPVGGEGGAEQEGKVDAREA